MELKYINDTGESITLRQTKPYFLTRVDGTGDIRQTISTFKAPEQDGAFYISSSLDMRNITIEGTIIADTADEAYTFRRNLLRIFTPKQQGRIIIRGRQIGCVVEEAGFTVSTRERIPRFFISLLCPSPFFETPDEIRRELALWMPLFSFVLEIPEGGIEFGSRQPSQIITVDNNGDVPCGCMIVFSALGSVTGPELMNLDTGEYVKLNTTMGAGEELRVYTHLANKRVTRVIGQTASNAFNTLDTGSTFLQLSAGRNTLRYNAEENIDLLEVSIFYRELYLSA
jgi:hypothetical protein